jgi:hypothetical protein
MSRCIYLLCLILCACSDSVVYVSVSALPPETRALRVVATVDGDKQEPQEFHDGFDRFSVRFPPGRTGKLSVSIEALGQDGCIYGTGDGATDVSNVGLFNLDVSTTPVSPRRCSELVIEPRGNGEGQVVSTPPGIACPPDCSFPFPEGIQVELHPNLQANSYLDGWSSPCESTIDCQLTIGRVTPVLSVTLSRNICTPNNFCWENPRPQGNTLRAVCSNGKGGWIAAGDSGTILRNDGLGWQLMVSPTTQTLTALSCQRPERILAVGWTGTLLALTDGNWRQIPLEANGNRITEYLTAVYSAGNSVFVGGDQGLLLHETTGGFEVLATPTTQTIAAIWANDSEVYVAADGIWRLVDKDWLQLVPGKSFSAIDGTDRAHLFAIGDQQVYRLTGTGWQTLPGGPDNPSRLWVKGPNEIVVLTTSGIIASFDGRGWSPMKSIGSSRINDFAFAGQSAFAVGKDGVMAKGDGTNWRSLWNSAGTIFYLEGGQFWGSAPDNIFVAGIGGIMHFDGLRWQRVPGGAKTVYMTGIYGVGAGGPGEVFTSSLNGIAEWDGNLFNDILSTPEQLTSIHGSGKDHLIAAGKKGALYRRYSGKWTDQSVDTGGRDFQGVWVGSENLAMAVGQFGLARLFDGKVWQNVDIGDVDILRSVIGFGPRDIVALGTWGRLWRWDGAWKFTDISDGIGSWPRRVIGHSWNDLWVVGDRAKICHFDGKRCVPIEVGTQNHLMAIWEPAPNELLVLGEPGAILRLKY